MPSPIAHAVSGYVLSRLLPINSTPDRPQLNISVQDYYAIFVAIAADFDFIPQVLTGADFHRGITHTLIFALGFSLLWAWPIGRCLKVSYGQMVKFTFILYSSHLVLDWLTAGGLGMQLLWPMTTTYFKSPLSLFPPVHHSRGLLDLSHLVFVSWELCYALLILVGLRLWQTTKQSKHLSE
ncbi:MAG: metal-dependent hydrolase [Microcoleaceae cyanobacterium]